MNAVLLFRLIDIIYWKKVLCKQNFNSHNAMLRFTSGIYINAILWASYTLEVFKYTDIIELTTMIVTIAGMAGGASIVLTAHKLTAISYSIILLIPGSILLILSTDAHHTLMGGLGIFYCAIIVYSCYKSSDFTLQAIELKNQNAVLVQQMEERVEQRTQRIYELSNIDLLTGLYNRTAFLKHLQNHLKAISQSRESFALLFIDLDGFKKINDSIGHMTGDKLLTLVAQRLKYACPNKQLLCRWGGDEFLMILNNTDKTAANLYAERIIEKISKPYHFNNSHLFLEATIGIAMYPEHSTETQTLITLADAAMYHQKKLSPSNACVFSDVLNIRLMREHKLKKGLSEAIPRQQLRVVFQPIVLSGRGDIVAFEALLRWRLNNENIKPEEFISIAEQYGMIREVGEWVLRKACQVASTWKSKKQIAVCVNVSVIQLQDPTFTETVASVLNDHRLPPAALHLEITESVFASDKNTLLNRIKTLRQMGIQVAIDDFGTGYSSLSILQNLQVDTIKIDRSFVNSIDTNGHSVIKAVMDIAESLNFSVIAEGVEDEEQSIRLSQLGVDFQQGYFYSMPVTAGEIPELLENSFSN